MKTYIRNGLAFSILLVSSGIAFAAGNESTGLNTGTGSSLNLTSHQERDIFQSVSKHGIRGNAPTGFRASVGEELPTSIKLRAMPSSASREVPAVKRFDYAWLENEVLIVSPKTKMVVDVITR